MFERFTEKARRVIFFARYECSALGSVSIGAEHLMLGLLREGQGTIGNYLKMDRFDLAERLKRQIPVGQQPISTSVDLPLNDSGKRVIAHASEEAEIMAHTSIGTEHLLLGILREEEGPVADVLRAANIPTLVDIRAAIAQSLANETQSRSAPVVNLVDEATGRWLPVNLSLQALPRVGESISFAFPDEYTMRYRVMDVHWGLQTSPGKNGQSLHTVQIMVRVDSVQGS